LFKSDLAATTLSCQQAQKVVSAVSGFKLAKYSFVKTTLRGDMMNQFCYKWYFYISTEITLL
jgi:hypothetical protein